MKRSDFVRGYAERSGLSAEWAAIGIIDLAGHTLIALPCACPEEGCPGWAMLSGRSVIDHLELYAPDGLRDAYRAAIEAAEDR